MTGGDATDGSGGAGPRRENAAGAVAGSAAGMLVGLLLGARGSWIVVLSAGALVAALIALAVAGERRWRRVSTLAVLLGVIVAASLGGLLLLAGRLRESAWPGGVPLALWLLFGVLWLVPLVLTGLGYAWTFELGGGGAPGGGQRSGDPDGAAPVDAGPGAAPAGTASAAGPEPP